MNFGYLGTSLSIFGANMPTYFGGEWEREQLYASDDSSDYEEEFDEDESYYIDPLTMVPVARLPRFRADRCWQCPGGFLANATTRSASSRGASSSSTTALPAPVRFDCPFFLHPFFKLCPQHSTIHLPTESSSYLLLLCPEISKSNE